MERRSLCAFSNPPWQAKVTSVSVLSANSDGNDDDICAEWRPHANPKTPLLILITANYVWNIKENWVEGWNIQL